ncbi:MAG: LuxR C-terminal-related transcriptional regulator [Pseudomonadota bacterium]
MPGQRRGDLDGLEAAERLIEAPDLKTLYDIAPALFGGLVGADRGLLYAVEGPFGRQAPVATRLFNTEREESAVYLQRFYRSDPLVAGIVAEAPRARTGLALSLDEVCGPQRTERTRFFRDFLGPIGLRHVLGVAVPPDPAGRSVLIGVHRAVGERGFSPAEQRRATALARVLSLAVRQFAAAPAPFPTGGGPFALTEREAEIARLAAEGLRNREIAARLELSPRTVENHLRAVFDKLGVENRAALAARRWQGGAR